MVSNLLISRASRLRKRLALPIERVADKHNPAENELPFTMGYSGKRSRFSPGLETLVTRATPYLKQESKSPPGWISEMCCALPYAPDRARSLDGAYANRVRKDYRRATDIAIAAILRRALCTHARPRRAASC